MRSIHSSGIVHLTVLASNAFKAGSFWEYRIQDSGNGGSQVEVTVQRVGKGLKGQFLTMLLRLAGRRVFSADFQQALIRIGSAPSVSMDERAPAHRARTEHRQPK